jgi:predicted phage tail protein
VTCQFDQTGTPQGVRVNYRDPRTFSPVSLLDPIDSPDYITVDLFGCTSGTVAQEHADLTKSRRRLQRKIIEFATELEGLNVLPGDRIGVQAGMVAWAQGARVERVAGRTLTVDSALVWTPFATHAVQLRDPTGTPVRVVGVTRGATDHELVLPADPPFPVTTAASNQEATTLAFGVQDEEVTDWTVSKVTPSGDTVTIEAANYDPAIYDAAAAFTRGELVPLDA